MGIELKDDNVICVINYIDNRGRDYKVEITNKFAKT